MALQHCKHSKSTVIQLEYSLATYQTVTLRTFGNLEQLTGNEEAPSRGRGSKFDASSKHMLPDTQTGIIHPSISKTRPNQNIGLFS
ncbi:uncharacterized protein LOC144448470 isoform X3 [Glandiceps talaboti]